jgi:hypothetical protein
MLPDDTKARREKMTEENIRQSHVDEHFKVATPEDKPQPYSDEILNQAAREWLIETNQVYFLSSSLDFGLTSSPSRFRLLNTLHFERWSQLQLVQLVASNWIHESRHGMRL